MGATSQVKNLSGGMRRRVEIARGLVHEPRIFFLDEPTTGLDPVSRVARLGDAAARSRRERDLTVLLTTHYMDEADKLCDRIAIVDHGELKALDSPLQAEGVDPGQERARGRASSAPPPDWARALGALPGVEAVTRRRPRLPHRVRATARRRRWRCWTRRPRAGVDGAVARRCRARRSTTCSCTTPAARCATRCRTASPTRQPAS